MSTGTIIDLPIADSNENNFSKVVPAEIVPEIAPHLASVLTPAVHRYPWSRRKNAPWQLSDVETGHCIQRPMESREDAIAWAKVRLDGKTVDDVRRAHAKLAAWVARAEGK